MSGVPAFTRPRPSVRGKGFVASTGYGLFELIICFSLDYLFQLAVEMKKLGLPWISHVTQIAPQRT